MQAVAACTTLAAVAEGAAARRTTAGGAARLLSMVRDTRAGIAATLEHAAWVARAATVRSAIPFLLQAALAVVAEAATSAEAAGPAEPAGRASGVVAMVVAAAAALRTLSQARSALRCGWDGEMRRVTGSWSLVGNE